MIFGEDNFQMKLFGKEHLAKEMLEKNLVQIMIQYYTIQKAKRTHSIINL